MCQPQPIVSIRDAAMQMYSMHGVLDIMVDKGFISNSDESAELLAHFQEHFNNVVEFLVDVANSNIDTSK